MNFVADESLDRPVVERLRHEGNDVVYVAELAPGISDDEVLQQANDRKALLMTADHDFGELVFRLGRAHAGVVLLRLAGLSVAAKADIVAQVVRDHAPELPGSFSVISPGAVRIRRPSSFGGPPDPTP
jgi:predicted nuclease of predicted toxin-antitoxin system